MDITDLLKEQGFSEADLESIVEAFDQQVAAKAQEEVELEVTSALNEQSIRHEGILKKVVDAYQDKHAEQLEEQAGQSVGKLKQLLKKHQSILNEKAAEFQTQLHKQLSDYLDMQLESVIPTDVIAEAAGNRVAQKQLEKIRAVAGIDDRHISGVTLEALKEGKQLIDSQQEEITKLRKLAKAALAKNTLSEATKGMPASKAEYLCETFKGKSPDFIKRNLDHVVSMFERNESKSQREERRRPSREPISRNVDRLVIEENDDRNGDSQKSVAQPKQESNPQNPLMDSYLESLGRPR